MKVFNNLFGKLKISFPVLIGFSILIGVYSGLVMTVPILKDTSFRDIGIGYEWWIFFAVIIITNSKKPLESAIKTFIFFVISQPIIYLVQPSGTLLFLRYYKNWIIPTIATIPMAYIGWFIKKDSIISGIILSPMIFLLGAHIEHYFNQTHYLSVAFCSVFIILFLMFVLKKMLHRFVAVGLSAIALAVAYFCC